MHTDIKFTIRRILKNKLGATINIIGLTIGILVSVALINYTIQESTYDHYHAKADRIHKVISKVTFNEGQTGTYGISFGTLAQDYKEKFPQVENAARLYGPSNVEIDLEAKRFDEIRLLRVDYTFFDLFDFPGLTDQSFTNKSQAILSKETADKIFGSNAIGKRITVQHKTYAVAAVVDVPKTTMFQFDLILPVETMAYYEEMNQGGLEFETYLLLNKKANTSNTIMTLSDHYNNFMKEKWPLYTPHNFLMPLKEVYLNSDGVKNKHGNGNKQLINIILTIAIVVLSLALINYVNLQIAHNHNRFLELRLKKILGAGKKILIKQGVIESLLIILASGMIAMLTLDAFYTSSFSSLLGERLLTIRDWPLEFWACFIISIVIIGTITGAIPSVRLFKKGSMTQQSLQDKKLGKMTVSLVVFQFFVTTALLTTIFFVNMQMKHLRDQPKGYSSEQVVMIDNLGDVHTEKYDLIKDLLEQHSNILNVTGSQNAPGSGASGQFARQIDQSSDQSINIAHIRTLGGYVETLGLEFVAGGDFTISAPGEDHQFILNQTATQAIFAENNPIGEVINMGGRVGKVVGVVKDFHFRTMHHEVEPLALNVEQPFNLTLMAKVNATNIESSLNHIQQVLSSVDPLYVFNYQFLDDQFDQLYTSEIQTQKIITYATAIAFSISIMGLLALSLFVINSKMKEIAIRKTLGGSQSHIFKKLSTQLMSWIIIGNLISIPASYYVAQSWVRDFVYQVDLSNLFWLSVVSTIVTIVVALSVIFRKLYKTMTMNPVVFLKYE